MELAPLAQVWIGTLPGWLTLAGVVVLVVLLRGGQVGPALGYLREANATLHDENRQLNAKVRELETTNATLRARPDLTAIDARLLEQSAAHEVRAQQRFERTCQILDLIAERLGPDTNGADIHA